MREVAGTDATVLLLGETGTGKDFRACGTRSESTAAPNPGAGELRRAAADTDRKRAVRPRTRRVHRRRLDAPGPVRAGGQGHDFLDEIGRSAAGTAGEAAAGPQEGEFERVGSSHIRKVDVRVIAATHRSLTSLTEAGQFRADLFYRLSVYPIHLPALRERPRIFPGSSGSSSIDASARCIGKSNESLSR